MGHLKGGKLRSTHPVGRKRESERVMGNGCRDKQAGMCRTLRPEIGLEA